MVSEDEVLSCVDVSVFCCGDVVECAVGVSVTGRGMKNKIVRYCMTWTLIP